MIKAMLRVVMLLLSGVGVAQAQAPANAMMVSDGWVREMPANMRMSAAFMVLMNHSMDAVSLLKASSPQFERVELHRSMPVDGVMRMVEQSRIPVPAQGKTILKPGDWHVMLMMGKAALKAGDTVDLTLSFDNGQELSLVVPVKKMPSHAGMVPPSAAGHGMLHQGHEMMQQGHNMMEQGQQQMMDHSMMGHQGMQHGMEQAGEAAKGSMPAMQ
ncbi:protein of unknown function DUF461 [Magnetococcus marinus MC-1]|uniref:Copper chaperone PCu(A)C n=1 Tax=Magnetococcus marinus (strain ATCC BAA-1437 / JCM 17883 / MC-1) TaxID=156889 RepID=A0L6J2_MAGMM|nr:copper chaperone PCu(A)C [Magnetococcus marinus]ABK43585.1 protein of unknown function DUF461 [Magnetococcus marinus MC-1]